MEAAQMEVGCIVRDPSAPMPDEQKFFRVIKAMDPEVGPWLLEHVQTRAQRTASLGTVEQFEPVDSEPYVACNFDGLIGKTVAVKTRWGSNIHGVVGRIEYFEFVLDGKDVRIPQALLLAGDLFQLSDVEALTYGD